MLSPTLLPIRETTPMHPLMDVVCRSANPRRMDRLQGVGFRGGWGLDGGEGSGVYKVVGIRWGWRGYMEWGLQWGCRLEGMKGVG